MTETKASKLKIIALDDDPTGSQTVHSCLLLTKWDISTLRIGLQDDSSPLFFVLTNTRALNPEEAASRTREVCANLKLALEAESRENDNHLNILLVSRSDSTLRGHYPIETDIIAEELGPFHAHFLIPAFFEGGRITRDSIHYLLVDGVEVPVHETEFAKDSVFGYSYSYLPDYVQEKTAGRIHSEDVCRFLLQDVRNGDVTTRLGHLNGNVCCVVDSETQRDLNGFCKQLMEVAASQNKHFLFRSGASLLTALAALPPQPYPAEGMHRYVRNGNPGAVVVGSHVQKSTRQLQTLLESAADVIEAIEVDVDRAASESDPHRVMQYRTQLSARAQAAHDAGKSVVIYTSRNERQFATQADRLKFGEKVSAFLMDIVQNLPSTIGFLISKGGITSNDVLSEGLSLRTSRVLGQILAGCSVVCCPDDHPKYPHMPVVIFPGNVGDENSLLTVFRRLANLNS